MTETNGNFFDSCMRSALSDGNNVYLGHLDDAIIPTPDEFDALWHTHPAEHAEIMMRGQLIRIRRWQQAFEMDYHFSGKKSVALPLPPMLHPYFNWARAEIDPRLNGLLVNWYDGSLGHYIGPHHDETRGLVSGSPIVTISLGDERIFRLTRYEKQNGKTAVAETVDLPATPGSVIVLTWATNLAWKHSVPHLARHGGRRISVTLRAFQSRIP